MAALVQFMRQRQARSQKRSHPPPAKLSSQPLSSLFPALGSPHDVVVLGFSPNGDAIVSMDTVPSVRLHALELSTSHVHVARPLRVSVLPLSGAAAPHRVGVVPWYPVEVVMMQEGAEPTHVATLTYDFSATNGEEDDDDEDEDGDIPTCHLQIWQPPCLLYAASLPAVHRQSCFFTFSGGCGDGNRRTHVAFAVNGGSDVAFFLVAGDGADAQVLGAAAVPQELARCRRLSTTAGVVCWARRTRDTLPLSTFHVERFLRYHLLPSYYPTLRVAAALLSFEARFVGPTEHGPHVLLAVSALLRPGPDMRSCKQVMSLIVCNPWDGGWASDSESKASSGGSGGGNGDESADACVDSDVWVLRVCDLVAFAAARGVPQLPTAPAPAPAPASTTQMAAQLAQAPQATLAQHVKSLRANTAAYVASIATPTPFYVTTPRPCTCSATPPQCSTARICGSFSTHSCP